MTTTAAIATHSPLQDTLGNPRINTNSSTEDSNSDTTTLASSPPSNEFKLVMNNTGDLDVQQLESLDTVAEEKMQTIPKNTLFQKSNSEPAFKRVQFSPRVVFHEYSQPILVDKKPKSILTRLTKVFRSFTL